MIDEANGPSATQLRPVCHDTLPWLISFFRQIYGPLAGSTHQEVCMRSSRELDWPFIGTWHLVSYESRDEAGGVEHPLGREVIGQLMYDAEGNMSAFVARANVPPFASGDLSGGSDAEVRSAFDGFVAYFGTYSFNLRAGVVIHHVRSASYPNWTGTEQVRYFKAEGQRLVLSTPIREGSRHLTAVLIWERPRDR
jgi:hypothetical protein